jgi:hypothetical protein
MDIIRNPLGNSDTICIECEHLLKRFIIPLDNAQFGINRNDLDIPDDEEIILEHYMCTEVLLDLDHTVVECNKFKPKIENNLLRNKF